MKFSPNEDWIKKLYEYFISNLWNTKNFEIKDKSDISSIFLAWAPWAWKTEFLETIFSTLKEKYIIIDIDNYRNYFIWYNWENASEYQKLSVKVADKILKFCFKNNLNFIFDWTFRNYNKVKQNLEQCKKYDRKTLVTLVFQEPRISFYYTYLRKIEKTRNVPIEVFVDWFYYSIENIFKAKKNFSNLEILIAYKKYKLLNKNKYDYVIYENIKNINIFCKKFNITYENWIFKNKDNLKLDISKLKDILDENFKLKNKINKFTSNIFIWFYEKFNKL